MQSFVKGYFLFLLLVFSVATPAAGAGGKISGSVNYCEKGGVLGMKVTLSGRSASIYTADDGKFEFDDVPDGNYAVFFSIDEKMIHVSKDVKVQAGNTTDMGNVAFCTTVQADTVKRDLNSIIQYTCTPNSTAPECVDSDKDGVVAGKDCNDHDETVRPGAPELCDGKDNNCDGRIDELGSVWIENGEGSCKNGAIVVKACKKGFADCDGDISNGCETNIMNDNNNCGACGNVCPALEICAAGVC